MNIRTREAGRLVQESERLPPQKELPLPLPEQYQAKNESTNYSIPFHEFLIT